MERFLQLLDQFMASLTITIQSNPELSSLILGGIRVIIDFAVKFVTFFLRLSEMLDRLSEHLQHLEEYSASCSLPLIRNATADVYGDLLKFCREARLVFVKPNGEPRKFVSFRQFLHVQWEPFETRFGDIESSFQHHLLVLLHSSQAKILSVVRDTQVHATSRELRQDRTAFLQRLSTGTSLDLANKYDLEQDANFSTRCPDTGDWIFRHPNFKEWLHSPDSALLWCCGGPGAGKSVLASSVVEQVSELYSLNNNVGLGFVYFKYDDPDSHKPPSVAAALMKQLCRRKEDVPSTLLEAFCQLDAKDRIPPWWKYQEMLMSVLDVFDQTFLVVDALDECPEQEREKILELIIHITDQKTHSTRTKVLITSRKEIDISEAFLRLRVPQIPVEAKTMYKDIHTFVKCRLDDLLRPEKIGQRLRLQDSTLRTHIEETLINCADGMFLWVDLQLKSLCRHRSDHDIKTELMNLPPDLPQTYERILARVSELPKPLRTIAENSINWVVYTNKTGQLFTARAVIEIATIDASSRAFDDLHKYSKDDLFEICANLLVEQRPFVRLLHQSFREYYIRRQCEHSDSGISTSFTNASLGNAHVAIACMNYLQLGVLRKSPARSWVQYNKQNVPAKPSLTWYTACYFDQHVVASLRHQHECHACQKAIYGVSNECKTCDMHYCCTCMSRATSLHQGHEFAVVRDPVPGNTRLYQDLRKHLGAVLSSGGSSLAALMQVRLLPKYNDKAAFREQSCETTAHMFLMSSELTKLPEWNNLTSSAVTDQVTLHAICATGAVESLDQVLLSKCDVNASDSSGWTPLLYATRRGRSDIVRRLIEHGANIDLTLNEEMSRYISPRTPLQMACYQGDVDVARTLLVHGADPIHVSVIGITRPSMGLRSENHWNCLHFAVSASKVAMVRFLLDMATVRDQQATQGHDVLGIPPSGKQEYADLTEENKKSGISFSQKNLDEALEIAAGHKFFGPVADRLEVVRLLLECGANPNASGCYGLQAACGAAFLRIVKLLIYASANLQARITLESSRPQHLYEYGPLHEASHRGCFDIVKFLLHRGADIASTGRYGTAYETAIIGFRSRNHNCKNPQRGEIIKRLVARGAEIPRPDCHYGIRCQGAVCAAKTFDTDLQDDCHQRWIVGTRSSCKRCWVELCADCRAQVDSNPEMYFCKPRKKKARVHEFVEFERRGDDIPDELLDTVLT